MAWAASQPSIFRILEFEFRGQSRRLPVGFAHCDLFEHLANVPSVFDEIDGQGVEQFSMRGVLAGPTKVFAGTDQSGTEALLPEAIDGDAGRQRVCRVGKPLCQLKTIARVFDGVASQSLWDPRLDLGGRLVVLSAFEDKSFSRRVHVSHDHDCGCGLIDISDLVLNLGSLV